MNEPRPAMISARPFESRSTVAKSWNTRTGSSELITETALVEPDPFRARGRGRKHDRRRRNDEVRAVVLTDAEDVEPEPVRELDLLHQVAHPPGGVDLLARCRVVAAFDERVDADLHRAPSIGARGLEGIGIT